MSSEFAGRAFAAGGKFLTTENINVENFSGDAPKCGEMPVKKRQKCEQSGKNL